MINLAVGATDRSQPAAPAIDGENLDRESLALVTLGNRSMEREVLRLFMRQAEQLLARMRASPPAAIPALARVLTLSARGIGAREVARAAQALELADGAAAAAQAAHNRLTAAIDAARAEIAGVLRTM